MTSLWRHINLHHCVMLSCKKYEEVYLALFLNEVHKTVVKNDKTLVFFHHVI